MISILFAADRFARQRRRANAPRTGAAPPSRATSRGCIGASPHAPPLGSQTNGPLARNRSYSASCCFASSPIARRTFLVLAGLDPAIHATPPAETSPPFPRPCKTDKGNALYCLAFAPTRGRSTRPIAWMAGSSLVKPGQDASTARPRSSEISLPTPSAIRAHEIVHLSRKKPLRRRTIRTNSDLAQYARACGRVPVGGDLDKRPVNRPWKTGSRRRTGEPRPTGDAT